MRTVARIRWLRAHGYIDSDGRLTPKGEAYAEERHLGTWGEDEPGPREERELAELAIERGGQT